MSDAGYSSDGDVGSFKPISEAVLEDPSPENKKKYFQWVVSALYAVTLNDKYEEIILEEIRADPEGDWTSKGRSFLITAISFGRVEIVKALLSLDKINLHDPLQILETCIQYKKYPILSVITKHPRIIFKEKRDFMLISACCDGNLPVVKQLLTEGVNPALRHNLPFQTACRLGRLDVVKYLASHPGVDIYDEDDLAIQLALQENQAECAQWLIENFPQVNPAADNNFAMRITCQEGAAASVQILLKHPSVDVCVNGNLPLCWACGNGHVDIVKMLMNDERIDITCDGDAYAGAFRRAVERKRLAVIKEFVSHPRFSWVKQEKEIRLSFIQACGDGTVEVVQFLGESEILAPMELGSDTEALASAVKYGHTKVMEFLFKFTVKGDLFPLSNAIRTSVSNKCQESVIMIFEHLQKFREQLEKQGLLKSKQPKGDGFTRLEDGFIKQEEEEETDTAADFIVEARFLERLVQMAARDGLHEIVKFVLPKIDPVQFVTLSIRQKKEKAEEKRKSRRLYYDYPSRSHSNSMEAEDEEDEEAEDEPEDQGNEILDTSPTDVFPFDDMFTETEQVEQGAEQQRQKEEEQRLLQAEEEKKRKEEEEQKRKIEEELKRKLEEQMQLRFIEEQRQREERRVEEEKKKAIQEEQESKEYEFFYCDYLLQAAKYGHWKTLRVLLSDPRVSHVLNHSNIRPSSSSATSLPPVFPVPYCFTPNSHAQSKSLALLRNTALQKALKHGNINCARYLIDCGADPFVLTSKGLSCADLISDDDRRLQFIRHVRWPLVRLLIIGASDQQSIFSTLPVDVTNQIKFWLMSTW